MTGALQGDWFDPARAVEVPAAKDAKGAPGLYLALRNGRTKAVAALVNKVIELMQDDILDVSNARTLLEARHPSGIPGFYKALENNHVAVIAAFSEPVIAAATGDNPVLNPEDVRILLKAKHYPSRQRTITGPSRSIRHLLMHNRGNTALSDAVKAMFTEAVTKGALTQRDMKIIFPPIWSHGQEYVALRNIVGMV